MRILDFEMGMKMFHNIQNQLLVKIELCLTN